MREIMVIMELIILILIKVQASDPLQADPSHLHNNVHSPLTTRLDIRLESCEEKETRLHSSCLCLLFH